jgi:hypothetical protein
MADGVTSGHTWRDVGAIGLPNGRFRDVSELRNTDKPSRRTRSRPFAHDGVRTEGARRSVDLAHPICCLRAGSPTPAGLGD